MNRSIVLANDSAALVARLGVPEKLQEALNELLRESAQENLGRGLTITVRPFDEQPTRNKEH